jgi:mannose-1-phosphate guanylyltransferase
MLPVGGVTMLERVVAKLGSHGVDEVVLSLGYQPDAFTSEFPDGTCAGVRLVYAVEPEPLDTAGAIAFAARAAGLSERVIAVNGDVLTDLDVAELWRRHEQFGGEATIALTPVEDPSRFGVVPLHPDGSVEAFIEKPEPGTAPSNWINAGTYVLEPSVLDAVPSDRKVSIERETFPGLVERGTLFAMQSDAYWIDAGTPAAYLEANLDLLDGVRGAFEVGIDPTARIDPDAKVSRSMIGPGAVIAAGSEVVDTVVMAGTRIGTGSRIERSLIGARSSIGESSELTDLTVVGFEQDLSAGTVASGGCFPDPDSW